MTLSARPRWSLPTVLCLVGGLVLLVGLGSAYVTRDDLSPVAALVALGLGNVLVLGGTVLAVRRERVADGLVLPDGVQRLPTPAWWWPAGATGLIDVLAGAAVTGWLGLVGVLLVADSMVAAGRSFRAAPSQLDRTLVRAARRLRSVAATWDERLVGALEPTGRSGVRVVAVGPDGGWVDVMLGSGERARAAAALAGVELHDQTDPAFSGAFAAGAGRWNPLMGPSG